MLDLLYEIRGKHLWVKGGKKTAIYRVDIGWKPETCGNKIDDDLDGIIDEGCPFGYLASANCEDGARGWARDSRKPDGSMIPEYSKAKSSVLRVRLYHGKKLLGQGMAKTWWDSTVGKHGFVVKPVISAEPGSCAAGDTEREPILEVSAGRITSMEEGTEEETGSTTQIRLDVPVQDSGAEGAYDLDPADGALDRSSPGDLESGVSTAFSARTRA